MSYVKYYVYKEQVSNDGGVTWIDTSPLVTVPSGDPLGTYDTLQECTGGTPPTPTVIYRWVDSGTTCVGYDKYQRQIKQVSTDDGATWSNVEPPEYSATTLLEANSEDCGYVPSTGYSSQYLTMEINSIGTVGFYWRNTNILLSYSLDNGSTWVTPDYNLAWLGLTVSTGDKILWKGVERNNTHSTGSTVCFSGTSRCKVYGNVMSLVYGDNFTGQTELYRGIFQNLFGGFSGLTGLTSAENLVLPSTTLARECYNEMFFNCQKLTKPPVLSATTLDNVCYGGMFDGCTSLTTAPQLPATTLVPGCYTGMFRNCTSLTKSPVLPAETLVENCYSSMFYGCPNLNEVTCLATDAETGTGQWLTGVSSSGTFRKSPEMTSWATGESGIPSNWTVVDYTG